MKKSKIYILPSLIIIYSITLGGLLKPTNLFGDELAFTNDPKRLILLGFSYLLAVVCLLRTPKLGLYLIKQNVFFFILLIFSLLSFLWSNYPLKVVINFGHYLGFLVATLATIYYFKDKQYKFYSFFSLVLGLSLLISIIVSIAIPKIGIHEITGRWQGVAGNPNTLGIICIASFWANAADYFVGNAKNNNWLKFFLLTITITTLIGSRSTTSFLVSFFAISGMWSLILLEHKHQTIKLLVFFLFIWMVIIILLSIYLIKPDLLTLEGTLALVGKDTTLTGRTTLWEIAVNAIDLKPFFGWSFDSNRSVLEQFGMKYGQFHNGYLDLIVRGGYVSLSIFIVIIYQALYQIKVLSKYNYKESIIWLVLLACILLHNITEASLMRETHLFWYLFVYLLHTVSSYTKRKSHAS